MTVSDEKLLSSFTPQGKTGRPARRYASACSENGPGIAKLLDDPYVAAALSGSASIVAIAMGSIWPQNSRMLRASALRVVQ